MDMRSKQSGVSVIIPTLNEHKTLRELVERIGTSMDTAGIPYEIIIIDDHSSDTTVPIARRLQKRFPLMIFRKRGKQGKGYSVLEGYEHATMPYIAMIDADLEYPPELLPALLKGSVKTGMSVARRATYRTSTLRRLLSRTNRFIFGRMLLGLDTDVQSGLKMFSREILDRVDRALVGAWSIDMPLLHTGYTIGCRVSHVDFDFTGKPGRQSHVRILSTIKDIAVSAIKTRFSSPVFHTKPRPGYRMLGSGVWYRRRHYVTHSTLPQDISAVRTFTFPQAAWIFAIWTLAAIRLYADPYGTVVLIIALLSSIYFIDVLFSTYITVKSLHTPPEISVSARDLSLLRTSSLPTYTILCPLYREHAVLRQYVRHIKKLDWPKRKLEVLLLLEEDDLKTRHLARKLKLPKYFRTLIVPASAPKTKPKALNYGLEYAKGEYVVVYDAEDQPEPRQLKKAYVAFQKVPATVVCLQAKLNYYNPHHNLLTKLFTIEYSLWFDVILPGLQSLRTSIPLGGTSNHFKAPALRNLHGWDSFNVTEDCDLGMRLFAAGYQTAIVDSTTYEEANSDLRNWIRQRSRWLKGYMQTYLVHMRHPVLLAKTHRLHTASFQLNTGGKIAFLFINPLLWAMTISYFVFRQHIGAYIEAIYPAPVFYIAAVSLVAGNFLYAYTYMIGCAKRGQWSLVKYVYLIPFYWLLMSWASLVAAYQLVFRPHFWEKTIHGLHLDYRPRRIAFISTGFASRLRALSFRGVYEAYVSPRNVSKVMLVAAGLGGNILNVVYHAYIGRHTTLETFATINLVGSFLYVSGIPLLALARSVTYKSAQLFGLLNRPAREFWRITRQKSILFAVLSAAGWVIASPFLARYFHTPSAAPFIIFTPVWIAGTLGAVNSGLLGGSLRFDAIAVLVLTEALSKLLLTYLFVLAGLAEYSYSSLPLSVVIAYMVSILYVRSISGPESVQETELVSLRFPSAFFVTSVLGLLTSITYLSADVMLAKHFLDPAAAGVYSYLSLTGKMVYLSGALVTQFMIPLVSHAVGSGKKAAKTFKKIALAAITANGLAYLVFGVFGYVTVPLLWGNRAADVIPFLPAYTLAMVFYSVSNMIIVYRQVRGAYIFPVAGFFLSLIQIAGISVQHDSIAAITHVVFDSSLVILSGILALSILKDYPKTFIRNIIDLLGLVRMKPVVQVIQPGRQRILIFNWRDTRHKWAGGAEVYIHELSKRWVAMGHAVTVFCGNDQLHRRSELVDGVWIIRKGGFYTVFLWAYLYYVRYFRNRYDVIIDSENGLPFFTPLYAREKKYLLIHHVHQEVFRTSLKPPFSWLAQFLERRAIPVVYRNTEVITVSPSSKSDILFNKLTIKEPHVIYNGIDLSVHKPGRKSKVPLVVYVGRLTTVKSLPVFIRTAERIIRKIPKTRFVIAGDGPARRDLVRFVHRLGLESVITFAGKVSEQEKIGLLQKAWVFLNPSRMEGWGITTIEANACGTPVVASNVSGLRDAVQNPHTGFLVDYGNVEEFTKKVARLIRTDHIRKRMSVQALQWAQKFSWDKSALESIRLLYL